MAGFRQLADRVAELAEIPSRAARPIADRIDAELRLEFAQGSNPYGEPWKDLAHSTVERKGHDLILIETGKLEAETGARPMSGAGVELVSNEIGGYHQSGTSRMPARKIFPDRSELPIAWQRAIAEEMSAAFRKVLK